MAEPGFFARICCCSRSAKEPPVTLIRTNDLPNAPASSISPARETVDGFEDQALEVPKEENGPKEIFRGKAPKWKNEENKTEESTSQAEENKDEMNMNDLMMADIYGEEQDKPNVEDAVSIRSNIVEEVDESELRQMSEILQPKDKIEQPQEEQASSRSGEIVSLEQMLAEGYQSPRIANDEEIGTAPEIQITEAEEPRDEVKEEKEFEEMQAITKARDSQEDEDSELEKEVIIHEVESTPPTASPRSILKTTPSTARSTESEEKDSDSPPPPLPSLPPPTNEILEGLHHAVLVNVEEEEGKPKTMMYADAETDSSEDEAEQEVLPPVAKPEDDKTDVEVNSSEEEEEEEEDKWEEKSEKENQITRLSVKSNGQATMTQGNVRIALESVEITDDEFSEKLI